MAIGDDQITGHGADSMQLGPKFSVQSPAEKQVSHDGLRRVQAELANVQALIDAMVLEAKIAGVPVDAALMAQLQAGADQLQSAVMNPSAASISSALHFISSGGVHTVAQATSAASTSKDDHIEHVRNTVEAQNAAMYAHDDAARYAYYADKYGASKEHAAGLENDIKEVLGEDISKGETAARAEGALQAQKDLSLSDEETRKANKEYLEKLAEYKEILANKEHPLHETVSQIQEAAGGIFTPQAVIAATQEKSPGEIKSDLENMKDGIKQTAGQIRKQAFDSLAPALKQAVEYKYGRDGIENIDVDALPTHDQVVHLLAKDPQALHKNPEELRLVAGYQMRAAIQTAETKQGIQTLVLSKAINIDLDKFMAQDEEKQVSDVIAMAGLRDNETSRLLVANYLNKAGDQLPAMVEAVRSDEITTEEAFAQLNAGNQSVSSKYADLFINTHLQSSTVIQHANSGILENNVSRAELIDQAFVGANYPGTAMYMERQSAFMNDAFQSTDKTGPEVALISQHAEWLEELGPLDRGDHDAGADYKAINFANEQLKAAGLGEYTKEPNYYMRGTEVLNALNAAAHYENIAAMPEDVKQNYANALASNYFAQSKYEQGQEHMATMENITNATWPAIGSIMTSMPPGLEREAALKAKLQETRASLTNQYAGTLPGMADVTNELDGSSAGQNSDQLERRGHDESGHTGPSYADYGAIEHTASTSSAPINNKVAAAAVAAAAGANASGISVAQAAEAPTAAPAAVVTIAEAKSQVAALMT